MNPIIKIRNWWARYMRESKYRPKIKLGYKKDKPFNEKEFNDKFHKKNKP